MTDESQFNQSPAMSGSPSPWTRRRVNAIYLAAYIVLGLAGIAVMAGSIWVAKTTLGMLPFALDPNFDPTWAPVPVTIFLTMLFWGILTPVSALLQPKGGGISDFGEIRIASFGMQMAGLGIVLLAGLACVSLAENAGVHLSVAMFGVLGTALGLPVINMIVGPKVRRSSPEIWAEALARSEDAIRASAARESERAKPVSKRYRWLHLIAFGGVLLFSLYSLLGLLGY